MVVNQARGLRKASTEGTEGRSPWRTTMRYGGLIERVIAHRPPLPNSYQKFFAKNFRRALCFAIGRNAPRVRLATVSCSFRV
jgi:hypothetical protein